MGGWDTDGDVSSTTTTETSYTISGLTVSTRYTIRVIAMNSVGDSVPSPEETVTVVARISQQPNTLATGSPSISGTARVGETLTIDTSGIADADGRDHAIFTYRWLRMFGRAALVLGNETSTSYLVTTDDVDYPLKVKVSFIDDVGNGESLYSSSTAVVVATVPGTPGSLEVQSAGTGELSVSWEAPAFNGGSAVTGYTVQWKKASDSWDSSTNVFATTTAETSHTITRLELDVEYAVRVIATNAIGDGAPSDEVTATTVAQTSQQQVATQNTPATGTPTISGTPQVGQTLTSDTSTIADSDGMSNASFSYQWIRSDTTTDSDISGATSSTYELASGDVGRTISVAGVVQRRRGQ